VIRKQTEMVQFNWMTRNHCFVGDASLKFGIPGRTIREAIQHERLNAVLDDLTGRWLVREFDVFVWMLWRNRRSVNFRNPEVKAEYEIVSRRLGYLAASPGTRLAVAP